MAQFTLSRLIAAQTPTESGSLVAATFFKHALGRSRVFAKQRGGSSGPRHQFPAAVRTFTRQNRCGARNTKSALERTYQRHGTVRRQICVAALAVGLQLQHRNLLCRLLLSMLAIPSF